MAKLFELACYPESQYDWEDFVEIARTKGWIMTGGGNLDMGDDRHCKLPCDKDWKDISELAESVRNFSIEETVMPLNIYDGQSRDHIDGNHYYDNTIPKVHLVHGGDIIWSLHLDAMIQPLSGKELKDRALQSKLVSLTYLSGEPLKDEDLIIAPSIHHQPWSSEHKDQECPGNIVFNCERVRKTRLRGKQNPMNGFKPDRILHQRTRQATVAATSHRF